jgi:hypothetical protein
MLNRKLVDFNIAPILLVSLLLFGFWSEQKE